MQDCKVSPHELHYQPRCSCESQKCHASLVDCLVMRSVPFRRYDWKMTGAGLTEEIGNQAVLCHLPYKQGPPQLVQSSESVQRSTGAPQSNESVSIERLKNVVQQLIRQPGKGSTTRLQILGRCVCVAGRLDPQRMRGHSRCHFLIVLLDMHWDSDFSLFGGL